MPISFIMEDSAKDNTPRIRSPTYSREEILLLLKLIEKYKLYILNKSTNTAANNAKDAAWVKIESQFNSCRLGHLRSAEALKGKWENLKRTIKKTSMNLLDTDDCELDDINSLIISLITMSDNIGVIDTPQDIIDDEIDPEVNDTGSLSWSEAQKESKLDADDSNEKSARVRSQNFTPPETKLLLQCVRKEKYHVFNKDSSSKANKLKNQAWARITDNYNRLSPQKRTAKCLKLKFEGMKKLARKIGRKEMLHKKMMRDNKQAELINDFNDSFKDDIKEEPLPEEKMDHESDQYSDQDNRDYNSVDDEDKLIVSADPLSCVLINGDSGTGSSSSHNMANWNWNQPLNKEIIKLQKELLNYQMETAKLERKRVEEAIAEDARERESRVLERALRMRAARLDAEAGAARLPPAHPALHFPPEETRAHHYLQQYHT